MSRLTTTERIAEIKVEHLVERVYDAPVIVIYPRHRSHTAVMGLVLRDINTSIYSYPLREEDTTLRTMLRNLTTDPQFPHDFGEETRSAIDSTDAPEEWATAFAADLGRLRSDGFVIVLDEMDRLKADPVAVDRFFRELVPHIPSQAQFLINGRELYRQPWNDLILDNYAMAAGDNMAIGEGIFNEPGERGQIEFHSLSGHSRILSDGRHIKSWDGSLPRNLCYYFINFPMVTRDEIFDIFWPHLGVKEATNVFHVTKRKISEKLGYEITAYSNGFYVPSPRVNVLYDAREFEEMVEQALSGSEELAPARWYRAVQLYRHPYLEGLNMPWIVEKREQLRDSFAQALIGLGRMYRQLNEPERALGYFLRAVSEKPDREDVHRNIMQLYYDSGRKDDAVVQYKTLESTLKRKFNITPSQETRALFDRLKS
jgi:DNA-binding SARP family transcriptional activator